MIKNKMFQILKHFYSKLSGFLVIHTLKIDYQSSTAGFLLAEE